MEGFWLGLTLPWQYEFARHALLVGMWSGVLCPVVGSLLVVQRLALLGDVIAHATLPGLALAYWLRWETLLGAVGSGVLAAMAVAWLRNQTEVRADGAMALIFAGFFASGILLAARLQIPVALEDLLFGNILNVQAADVWRTAGVTLVVLALLKIFYKEILFCTFDRQGAAAAGLPVSTRVSASSRPGSAVGSGPHAASTQASRNNGKTSRIGTGRFKVLSVPFAKISCQGFHDALPPVEYYSLPAADRQPQGKFLGL
ncbi:MAG: metal ABC transporter permease [Oscillatoriales cyanobacterium SM2_1_8]|nr:metal ABC transporter permease [Oscillatoriales cyanobacterium SM2_1_8]